MKNNSKILEQQALELDYLDPSSSKKFSDFIVYVDESGDHSLISIDKEYPVFVLAFCIFYKSHYSNIIVPKLQSFKFKHFGHDSIILHENEIRKEKGAFNLFINRIHKNAFIDELTNIIFQSNFILACCVIEKNTVVGKVTTQDLYHLALKNCLESLFDFVKEKSQEELRTHVIVESRGNKEDNALELAFRRICDGDNKYLSHFPFEVIMAKKAVNSAGLQLADLVARPIGRYILNPEQPNRAFDILKNKFFCADGRKNIGNEYNGHGLKVIS